MQMTARFEIIAGIDPGKSGAMAILYPDNAVNKNDRVLHW